MSRYTLHNLALRFSSTADLESGRTLYYRGDYSEAEESFRQVADGREKTLGRDHEHTLYSKYWLGLALYKLKRYTEAEESLRQAADGRERTLGRDHTYTLYSKYWLGLALYKLDKYTEAEESLRQAADGQEKTLGRDHEHTLHSKHLVGTLRKILSSQRLQAQPLSTISPTATTNQQALASRLNVIFSGVEHRQESYSDDEIKEISMVLKHVNSRWGNMTRTYIILRTIGHLDLLDALIDVGFSDYWLPVTERSLPDRLTSTSRAGFLRAQLLVLTESLGLEKGDQGRHCNFKPDESPPFESKGVLGTGAFGQVDKVLSLISFKEYARKRVLRSAVFGGRRAGSMKQLVAEIELLKRIKHRHIVEFVGSYTDRKYIGLIILPIAEMDLSVYLSRATVSDHPQMRTFFGCLATALEFLHEQKVRHKDIKPGNILINHGTVLLADFGLAFDSIDASGSTTTGMVNGLTPRYCAPEVYQHEPRNSKSDIWSLGIVFIEMVVVLKGVNTQYFNDFFSQHGSRQTLIRTNLEALPDFFTELGSLGEVSDNKVFRWIQQMLALEQHLRPTASSLVETITALGENGESTGFCGICCVPEEDFSDWTDE